MADTAMTRRRTETPARAECAERTRVFTPRVDIRETENEVVLVADLPGVDEKTVDIDLEGSELTIRARTVPEAGEGYSPTYREYEGGSYERSFTLGDTIDRDGIAAVVKDGVLQLTLPKAKEARPTRIAVTAG